MKSRTSFKYNVDKKNAQLTIVSKKEEQCYELMKSFEDYLLTKNITISDNFFVRLSADCTRHVGVIDISLVNWEEFINYKKAYVEWKTLISGKLLLSYQAEEDSTYEYVNLAVSETQTCVNGLTYFVARQHKDFTLLLCPTKNSLGLYESVVAYKTKLDSKTKKLYWDKASSFASSTEAVDFFERKTR